MTYIVIGVVVATGFVLGILIGLALAQGMLVRRAHMLDAERRELMREWAQLSRAQRE